MEAAERLAALSPQTKERLEQFKLEGWSAGEKPYVAFRSIGAAMVEKRAPLPPAEMKSLLGFAEHLLVSGSFDVANLVATCLLETIWIASRQSGFDFSLAEPYLGSESRKYLSAWRDMIGDR